MERKLIWENKNKKLWNKNGEKYNLRKLIWKNKKGSSMQTCKNPGNGGLIFFKIIPKIVKS